MSVKAIFWSFEQNIPGVEKWVLVGIANYYNDDQQAAWMKQGTLANFVKMDRGTVNRALQRLEHEHKLIRTEQRRYPDGRNAGKTYRLNISVAVSNSGNARVAESNTDSVAQSNTDRVAESHNKNLKHRTKNIEPINTSSKTTIDYNEYLQAWNNNCGHLPKIRVLSQSRKRKIKQHIKEYGNDALPTFTQAVQAVANEDFWIERSYGIDNLLRDKITTYAEKHQARKTNQRPAILDINPEDLF